MLSSLPRWYANGGVARFAWDGTLPLMHVRGPAVLSTLYLLACAAHNQRRLRKPLAPSAVLDVAAVLHNALLAAFSVVACASGSYYLGIKLHQSGIHNFLCPPLPQGPQAATPAPLDGPLHGWCYIFYLSKYWELLDTVLLISRGKRVIFLHAFHHAMMPPLMAALFQGRVSISLVALTIINGFVHIVMYSYFTLSALHLRPSEVWKKQITRLQIFQFSCGLIGGTYYWVMHVRSPHMQPVASWPPLIFERGCDGGDDIIVLGGYVGNLILLYLFSRFYLATYHEKKGSPTATAPPKEVRDSGERTLTPSDEGSSSLQHARAMSTCNPTPYEAEAAALLEVPLDAMAPGQPPLARLFRVAKILACVFALPPTLVLGLPLLITAALLVFPLVAAITTIVIPIVIGYAALFDKPILAKMNSRANTWVKRGLKWARRVPSLAAGAPRDFAFVLRLVKATRQLNLRLKASRGGFTTADYWNETVAKYGSRPALLFEGHEWSYSELDALSARLGSWARYESQLRPGEPVGLISANRPEHLVTWLGLARVHIPTALLHTGLRGSSLSHALAECNVQAIIFDHGSAERLAPAAAKRTDCRFYLLFSLECVSDSVTSPALPTWALPMILPDVARVDWDALPAPATTRATDPLVFIFTSGTTGMPKAAKLTHVRFFSAIVITYMFDLNSNDRLYCCLPMCHTAAFGAVSLCWWLGIPLILAKSFSASRFWKDVSTTRCTLVQYVGELCRFLLQAPPSEFDRSHCVRLAFGNGMRPDVWPRFVERFKVPRIGELYASTEGNANLANTENKPGAVGFISPLLAPLYPVKLVRLADDDGTAGGELMRRPDGLCVECEPGEAGELLGKVDQRDASRNFAGYTDRLATARRLVRNVAKHGDAWFRTGDLLRTDEAGFVYFVDRMGDTFRFRGENVSTSEVEAVLGSMAVLQKSHAVVYGIELPNSDGRVGMSSIFLEAAAPYPDLHVIYSKLEEELPSHAHPRFLRVVRCATGDSRNELETTLTFKPKKAALASRGISSSNNGIGEEIYIRSAREKTYTKMTAQMRTQLLDGTFRLE